MDPDCKRIAHSPGPLLLMTRSPTVPHLLRRVRRAAKLSAPPIGLSADTVRRVRRSNALRRPRSTLPRVLPAGIARRPALTKARPVSLRPVQNSIDLSADTVRRRAALLPCGHQGASGGLPFLRRLRSACQRTLSASPNQRAVCVQRSSIRSRSATRSAKASALCSGARRMAAGW